MFHCYLSCTSIPDEIFPRNLVSIFYFDFPIIPTRFLLFLLSTVKSCASYLLRTPIPLFLLYFITYFCSTVS